MLCPNIFYFLVGILYVFATYAARYACITKRDNLLDKKAKPVSVLMSDWDLTPNHSFAFPFHIPCHGDNHIQAIQ